MAMSDAEEERLKRFRADPLYDRAYDHLQAAKKSPQWKNIKNHAGGYSFKQKAFYEEVVCLSEWITTGTAERPI